MAITTDHYQTEPKLKFNPDQAQTLLGACHRFAIVRFYDSAPASKKDTFVGQPFHLKTIQVDS